MQLILENNLFFKVRNYFTPLFYFLLLILSDLPVVLKELVREAAELGHEARRLEVLSLLKLLHF